MSEILSQKIGYFFRDVALLNQALTHRSLGDANNERLEFLGDSIVNFVIAEALYHQFPEGQEGELSRWRASLVNRDSLAELARQFNVGDFLLLGMGELRSGGSQRQSILSCAMEAIIGAIYLDGGFASTKDCILKWYDPLLKSLSEAKSHKDPKTLLQEYLQSHRFSLPVYSVESIVGKAHQQSFIVKCYIESLDKVATGKGTSRRRAEQAAAEAMLALISSISVKRGDV